MRFVILVYGSKLKGTCLNIGGGGGLCDKNHKTDGQIK